jgi:hypothetical protein
MKKLTNIVLVFMLFVTTLATAQYGIGTTSPDPSAQLELNSTSKGFLMPRMTTLQRDAIASPAAGLMIYNLDSNKPNFFNGISWIELAGVVVGGATVSGVPTDILVTPGDTQASVAFTAPSNNGGSAITNYIVTANPGALTAQGTSSPITVTGLVNGTAYTFSVVAVNAVGNSASSVVSAPIIPIGAPGAPINPVASYVVGTTEASIAFEAPTNNGGATITGYTVTSNPGGLTATGPASPLVVTGLSMNQAYTFSVVANNGVNSVASIESNSITTVPNPPSAPTNVVATAGDALASVAFSAPTNNGGSPVTSYTVTSSPGNFTSTGTESPITVNGLTNGTAYTFTVVAANTGGNSVASDASAPITPVGAPDAPTSVVASYTSGTTQSSISFSNPANNGGASITSYTVTSSPGGFTATGSSSPLVVTGLAFGTSYTFTVTATNGVSTSNPSSPSNSITTVMVAPSAPQKLAVVPGNGKNVLTWQAPVSGSPVQNYIVQARGTWELQTWTDIATLSSSTLTYEDLVGNTVGDNNVRDRGYRVVASNAAGSNTTDVTISRAVLNGVVLVHDNFNQIPSSPIWEFNNNISEGGTPQSFLAPEFSNLMYGQPDGKWKVVKAPDSPLSIATVTNIDRNAGDNGVVVQFNYTPIAGAGFQPWDFYFGFIDATGRKLQFNLNNQTNFGGRSFGNFLGDWSSLGNNTGTIVYDGSAGSAFGSTYNCTIIFPKTGGMTILSSAGFVATYDAAKIPPGFNNFKFYMIASGWGNGNNFQKVDDFTILSY